MGKRSSAPNFQIYCDKRYYSPLEDGPETNTMTYEGYIFWLVDEEYLTRFLNEALEVVEADVLKDVSNFECFSETCLNDFPYLAYDAERNVASWGLDIEPFINPYVEIPTDERRISSLNDLSQITNVEIVQKNEGVFLSASALFTVERETTSAKSNPRKIKTIYSSPPPPSLGGLSNGPTPVKLFVPIIAKIESDDFFTSFGDWFDEASIRIYFPGRLAGS
jgi:hypothetical protein